MLVSLKQFGFSDGYSFKAECIEWVFCCETAMQLGISCGTAEDFWSHEFENVEELKHQFVLLNDFINRWTHGSHREEEREILFFPGFDVGDEDLGG